MNYQTFEPHQDLNSFVKCYWTLESPKEDTPERQRIVPDGCMEMIFHYGDQYKQYLQSGETIVQPRCFVFGQLTRPLEIEPTGVSGIFSVRFHPEGFMPFASLPIKKMENRAVPLEELFGEEGRKIEQDMLNASTTTGRVVTIEGFLMSRLTRVDTIDKIVKSTVETILAVNGELSVEELSMKANINRRNLERKFSSVIGLSPKQLSRIVRLQAVLKMLQSKEYRSLTELAHEGDYYDQAHFIKDFREFTGRTPKEFYGDNLKMSSLFSGAD